MAASIASRAVYSFSLHAHTIKSKPEVDSVVAIEGELSTAFRKESRASSLNISNQWIDLPRRRTLVRLVYAEALFGRFFEYREMSLPRILRSSQLTNLR
jgi:hypothetical protein